MSSDEFKAIFSLVDGISAPIMAITAKVSAANAAIEGSAARMSAAFAPLREIQGAFGNLHTQISRLGANVGLDRISASAATLTGRIGGLTRQITGMLGPVAALGGLGSLGGMVGAMNHAVEGATARHQMLESLGARTPEQRRNIGNLGYSARMAGADPSTIGADLGKLQNNMAEAATGRNAQLASLFNRLRIPLRDANGQMRTAADLLPQLGAAFERNTNGTVRSTMATALFGRSGRDLIVTLAELRENTARKAQFGFAMSPEDEARLLAQGKAQKDLSSAVSGTADAIGAQLAPIITPMVENMAKWIAANRALVVGEVRDFVKGLADNLNAIDWAGAWQGVKDFGRGVNDVVQRFGGWQVAVGAAALVMAGPFLSAVAGVGTALAGLAVAVVSTPIGLFAAGLAAAGYAIYANWETISGAFSAATEAVSAFFARFMERAGPTIELIGTIASALGAGLLAPVRAAWDGIASLIEGAAGRIMRVLQPVLNIIGSITGNGRTTAAAESTRPAGTRRRGTINGAQAIEDLPDPANDAGSRAETLRQAGTQGVVRVQVDFANMPPGATASADATGAAVAPPQLAVGYAMGGAR